MLHSPQIKAVNSNCPQVPWRLEDVVLWPIFTSSILAPLPPVEYPTVKRKRKADAVAEWLRAMGLDKYEGSFVDNGYDDLAFLGDDVLDGKALEDNLGVADKEERDAIMEKVKGNRHVKGKKNREKRTNLLVTRGIFVQHSYTLHVNI